MIGICYGTIAPLFSIDFPGPPFFFLLVPHHSDTQQVAIHGGCGGLAPRIRERLLGKPRLLAPQAPWLVIG